MAVSCDFIAWKSVFRGLLISRINSNPSAGLALGTSKCIPTIRLYSIKVIELFRGRKVALRCDFKHAFFRLTRGTAARYILLRSDRTQSVTKEVRTLFLESFTRNGVVAPKVQLVLRL